MGFDHDNRYGDNKYGDRKNDKDGKFKKGGKDAQKFMRKKFCRYCQDKKLPIDYKEPRTLFSFVSERGRIAPRRISGLCAIHQRRVTDAIKKARVLALLPYTALHQIGVVER